MLKDEWLTAIAAVLGCSDEIAATLGQKMRHCLVPHKTVIAHQGDLSDHCWLVLDGTVRVQLIGWDGRRVQLAYHGPGEFFGAYPEATTCRADVIANGDVRALRISTSVIAGLAETHASISYGLSRLLARQRDLALDRMAARTTLSASGRVHSELLRLADDDNCICPVPTVTALAMSVNTTRETASRTITALERRGIIRREGQILTIQAPRMLEEMVI